MHDEWAELRRAWDHLVRTVWADRWSLGLFLGSVWVIVATVALLAWLL